MTKEQIEAIKRRAHLYFPPHLHEVRDDVNTLVAEVEKLQGLLCEASKELIDDHQFPDETPRMRLYWKVREALEEE